MYHIFLIHLFVSGHSGCFHERLAIKILSGPPWWHSDKDLPANAGDTGLGLILDLGRSQALRGS